MLPWLWYRVIRVRLLTEPHLLARDLLVAALVIATRRPRP
jgi:hypothetical protein